MSSVSQTVRDKATIPTKDYGFRSSELGRGREERWLRGFILISFAFHTGIILIKDIPFLSSSEPLVEEWSIDADLLPDLDDPQPASETSLPKAKEAPEPAVPENVLPQLPKKITIDKPLEKEKGEEIPLEEDKTKEKDKLAEEESKKEEKGVKEEEKPEDNKITPEEIRKRLAFEKLRLEKKTDKNDVKSPVVREIASLKEKLAKRKASGGADGAVGAELAAYARLLAAAVKRNFVLPRDYEFRTGNLSVVIAIKLSSSGKLMESRVHKESGDSVYDDLNLQAVRVTSFPPPAEEQVGKEILIVLNKNS